MDRAEVIGEIVAQLGACSRDPMRFVLWSFEWGDGELVDHPGPDEWQSDILCAIRDGLLSPGQAVQIAIASGHGIGKSALVAWIILWAVCTFEDARGVVTANTDNQLRTKTWAELATWYRRSIVAPRLFELTATAIYSRQAEHEKTWRIDMVPWSERNTEAFAGLHNKGKRVLLVFDEASAIPDIIWETAEGALTDSNTEIVWFVAGNPTRNSGRFRELFGRLAHRWIHRQIDSRTARMTNKAQIAQWVQDYGEDSDFVRVRVRGVFPRAGSMQFIGSDLVDLAARRDDIDVQIFDPLVLGVDPARFGDDQSVIYIRKGRDGRTQAPIKLRGVDTMTLAAKVAELYQQLRPDAVFVDGGGVGGGVVDRLRQLRIPVIEVQFGGAPDRSMPDDQGTAYGNKGAECWGVMREWLKGGAIPDDHELRAELEGREYGYTMLRGRDCIVLEKKSDMKKRGLASPDTADALALTFAYPVQASRQAGGFPGDRRTQSNVVSDWDPLGDA